MIIIKCAKCKRKLFKYIKVGRGRLWHCWKERILEDYSNHNGNTVRCSCGEIIGVDQGKWINLKQYAVFFTGPKTW